MPTETELQISSSAQLARIIESLESPNFERRVAPRFPFFRPASVSLAGQTPLDAFTRDLSRSGVGLLHRELVPNGPVEVAIHLQGGETIVLPANIMWSENCGQGWYTSGAVFVE